MSETRRNKPTLDEILHLVPLDMHMQISDAVRASMRFAIKQRMYTTENLMPAIKEYESLIGKAGTNGRPMTPSTPLYVITALTGSRGYKIKNATSHITI